MPDETKLYLVQGNIVFNSGNYIDDFCLIPGSSFESVKGEYLSRIEEMKRSPHSSAIIGQKVVEGNILEIREVDLSSYGYQIKLERIINQQ